MISYKECFSDNEMIKFFCKKRIKLAKKRNRKHLLLNFTWNTKFNYHCQECKDENENILSSILPSRRSWIKLGKDRRYKDGQLVDSATKNYTSLLFTVRKALNDKKTEKWLSELTKLVGTIRKEVFTLTYRIKAPITFPKIKDDKDKTSIICRPISVFNLQDSLVITQTNKYLTQFFDSSMLDYAFAFRASRCNEEGKLKAIRHHDAFQKIIDYRSKHSDEDIYVAECDMKKFFDTVNHKVVVRQFFSFILRKFISTGKFPSIFAVKVFLNYLKSYSFYRCVFSLNETQEHFNKHGIENGKYEWIKKAELKQHYKENQIEGNCIGIPQGGALSGLIANIVLDYADRQIKRIDDANLLYLRYCDDMIIMHTDKNKCQKAFDVYFNSLKKLKLYPHEPVQYDSNDAKEFWKSKTKKPYLWDKSANYWITFVGYDIAKNGDIRVRKKSLEKEMNKQKDVINEILRVVSQKGNRASNSRIIESAKNRLIGMSVGRFTLRNYNSSIQSMCWANGFKLLNDNKTSRYQLKMLDRSRNKEIARLIRILRVKNIDKNKNTTTKASNRQLIYYGKPFSYYYAIIEKQGENK